jgi:hypothetical protein
MEIFKDSLGQEFEMVRLDKSTVQFLVKWIGDFDYCAEFEVFEVGGWYDDGTPVDYELYLKGTIKWDGCSHIWFGDENNYLHLCGKYYFDQHCKLLEFLWLEASRKVKHFNKDLAS